MIQLEIDFKDASLKSGALGQDLQTMFLEYSDSFLRDAQASKEQIELKAAVVEEVRMGVRSRIQCSRSEKMRIPSASPHSLRLLLLLLLSNQCPNAISVTDNEEAAERDGHDHHKLYLLLIHIRRGIHHLGKQDH